MTESGGTNDKQQKFAVQKNPLQRWNESGRGSTGRRGWEELSEPQVFTAPVTNAAKSPH